MASKTKFQVTNNFGQKVLKISQNRRHSHIFTSFTMHIIHLLTSFTDFSEIRSLCQRNADCSHWKTPLNYGVETISFNYLQHSEEITQLIVERVSQSFCDNPKKYRFSVPFLRKIHEIMSHSNNSQLICGWMLSFSWWR